MAYTETHHKRLKELLPLDIGAMNETNRKELAGIYNESEGSNLGSYSCIDCVAKMKNTLQTRFNEFELWLDMMERKAGEKELTPLEKVQKEVEDYTGLLD